MRVQDLNYEEMTNIVKNIDIGFTVGISYTGDKHYYVITSPRGDNIFPGNEESINDLNRDLLKAILPRWTKLTNACMSIIGTEVWIDKEIPIVVTGMKATLNGVVVSTVDRTYNITSLWIKE